MTKSLSQSDTYIIFFFFNDTATTEIYTLSLHDALPIWPAVPAAMGPHGTCPSTAWPWVLLPESSANATEGPQAGARSEEHTSELQSRQYLVCRLLLEKKKGQTHLYTICPSIARMLTSL